MHVVFFSDQHLESFGGAQVSMRLQRRFLERAGHTVTVVAPRMHGPRGRAVAPDPGYLDMPSVPITPDREYSLTWPGRRTDAWVDAALAGRPPVDVVHVQADFWGAFIGHRYAARHRVPVVHTMHNRVDVGIQATAPFPHLVLRVLNAWERRALRGRERRLVGDLERGHDGWSFLRRLAVRSDAVTAPSSHFARRLEEHGVVPRGRAGAGVDVVWNGIDDDVLDAALASGAALPRDQRPADARLPTLVWMGRMSPEKRLLPFLEAVAASGIRARVEVLGGGGQLRAARRLVERLQPTASVVFSGRMPYAGSLARLRSADALVQTSIGFETQGMTPFEAAALGTPSIISDPDIARELGSGFWAVGGGVDCAPDVADGSVAALAQTLRQAVADIEDGTPVAPNPEVRERFRQSSRSAAMVEIYERVRV
ncbi:glycosyltransferase [Microbacterium sp. RU33B]|uniref:glycosyltransferase n=1 Tax=Microbacterium sp. RU33B TaxID=1907390 RepID=UPI000966D772|nr:glycosyltransferase [Microbacterium sp. RU33B]SIT86308.1 Glycosyltransferase involved in cell wall bisynthesis [Microbacterium sp. RU33B]